MGRRKNRHARADEWALNSIVAADVADSLHEFSKIRRIRKEVDPRNQVTQEYYDFLKTTVQTLREPRIFRREDFKLWFDSTCSSSGHKSVKQHIRIPKLDHKGLECFTDVLWTWVCFLRSKYVEARWR